MKKVQLNGFQIKLIALVIMTIDHFAHFEVLAVGPVWYMNMRKIGRIAAPLFLYLAVEGLHHTRSKPRYILRLYFAGAATGAVNAALTVLSGPESPISFGNIFHTFFYLGFYVYCIETLFGKPKRLLCRAAALGGLILPFLLVPLYMAFAERGRTNAWIILSIFLPSPLIIEYSFLFVLLGIAWYFVHNKYLNCAIFSVFSLVCMAVPSSIFDSLPLACFTTPYCSFYQLFVSVQWLMILAVPFILLYNGEKGQGMKYFFYFYYPLHQYLFFALGVLLPTVFGF